MSTSRSILVRSATSYTSKTAPHTARAAPDPLGRSKCTRRKRYLMLVAALDALYCGSCEGRRQRRASRGGRVVMRRSDGGCTWVEKFGIHLARTVIADLGGVRRAFLCQPGEQRPCARSCAAAGCRTSDRVVAVEVGSRGRAGRAQTAARCATWASGPR